MRVKNVFNLSRCDARSARDDDDGVYNNNDHYAKQGRGGVYGGERSYRNASSYVLRVYVYTAEETGTFSKPALNSTRVH